MDIKTEINKLFTPDQKAKFQSILKKFNPAPIPNPLTAATPPVVAPVVAAPVALQESPLEDGTILKYNTPTLSVGSVVTIVSPEGELPAPAGELKLKDGTVIVVTQRDGASTVESVTPSAAPAPVDVPMSAPQLQVAPLIAQMEAIEKKFSAATKENETLKKTLETSNQEFKAQLDEINKNVSEFITLFAPILDTPSDNPIVEPKNKFKKATNIEKFINR